MKMSCNPDVMLDTIKSMKASNITLTVTDDGATLSSRERIGIHGDEIDIYSVRNVSGRFEDAGAINLPVEKLSEVCKWAGKARKHSHQREIVIGDKYLTTPRDMGEEMIGPLMPGEERERDTFIGPMPLEQSSIEIDSHGDYGIVSHWQLICPEGQAEPLELGDAIASLGYRASALLDAIATCEPCIDTDKPKCEWVERGEGDAKKQTYEVVERYALRGLLLEPTRMVGCDGRKLAERSLDPVWGDGAKVKAFLNRFALPTIKKYLDAFKPMDAITVTFYQNHTAFDGPDGDRLVISQPREWRYPNVDDCWPYESEEKNRVRFSVKSFSRAVKSLKKSITDESRFCTLTIDGGRAAITHDVNGAKMSTEFDMQSMTTGYPIAASLSHQNLEAIVKAMGRREDSIICFYGSERPVRFGWDDTRWVTMPAAKDEAQAEPDEVTIDDLPSAFPDDAIATVEPMESTVQADEAPQETAEPPTPIVPIADPLAVPFVTLDQFISIASVRRSGSSMWVNFNGDARLLIPGTTSMRQALAKAYEFYCLTGKIQKPAAMAETSQPETNPPIRKPKVKMTEEQLNAIDWESIADRYASGESDRKIARATGIPRSTIYYRLRRMGVVLEKAADVIPFEAAADLVVESSVVEMAYA